jgi:hypothetical protein
MTGDLQKNVKEENETHLHITPTPLINHKIRKKIASKFRTFQVNMHKNAHQRYMSTSKGKYDYFANKKAPEECRELNKL